MAEKSVKLKVIDNDKEPGISVRKKQEDGIKITIVTLKPETYPEGKVEDTKNLVEQLKSSAIFVRTQDFMHEHFAIIDGEIVWYGSMNFLSRTKTDDNMIRVTSAEIAQELMELTFADE